MLSETQQQTQRTWRVRLRVPRAYTSRRPDELTEWRACLRTTRPYPGNYATVRATVLTFPDLFQPDPSSSDPWATEREREREREREFSNRQQWRHFHRSRRLHVHRTFNTATSPPGQIGQTILDRIPFISTSSRGPAFCT